MARIKIRLLTSAITFINIFNQSQTRLVLKTLSMIADEYGFKPKTFKNHLKKDAVLNDVIKRGLQPPKMQKLVYDTLGYPPGVDKSDYEKV